MIITVASYKGGVGKTTTAMHIAAYLQTLAPTVLFDGDSTRNASKWAGRRDDEAGPFPFKVAPEEHTTKLSRGNQFEHHVMDTGQKPTDDELQAMVDGCDLMIVPVCPAFLEADGLGDTLRALQQIEGAKYRVLLTKVPHHKATMAAEIRTELLEAGVAMFDAEIPRLEAFDKAAGAGLIVSEVDDRNATRAWMSYWSAGKELGL